MPLPKEVYADMIERHAAAHVVTQRMRLRVLLRTVLICWAWVVLGVSLMGWAVHTRNASLGYISFWSGLAVGNGGVLFTLIAAWRASARRGEQGPPA